MAPTTCTSGSPTYNTGCLLLKHYSDNGMITVATKANANTDWLASIITTEELLFINNCFDSGGNINNYCPGCISGSSTPSSSTGVFIVSMVILGYLILTRKK